MSDRSRVGVIRSSLDRRRDSESDVQPRRYVRPLARGLHVVKLECNEQEIVVAGSRAFAPGSHVQTGRHSGRSGEVILTEPPPGRRGVSALPIDRRDRDLDALGIVLADPDPIDTGSATAVTVNGFGFRESPVDTFSAVLFDESSAEWETDPLVTIGAPTWVDSETVTLSITPDASLPEDYRISLRVERA